MTCVSPLCRRVTLYPMRLARIRPLLFRSPLASFALAALLLTEPSVHAADPLAYGVMFVSTGDEALDRALNDSSQLVALRETAPVGPFALVARARDDAARLETVLDSFGYYDGMAVVTVGGRQLDDPYLLDQLERAPSGVVVPVTVSVVRGAVYHLGKIDIQGTVPADVPVQLGMKPGAAALASDVLAAREHLLEALRGRGYALARVDKPIATLDTTAKTLAVEIKVDAGPRLDLGWIGFKGVERTDEGFLRRRLLVHSGDRFDPEAIEKARQDFINTGVFSSVRARTGERPDEDGRLPLDFEMAERPLHAVGFNGAWSTDVGGSLSVSWQHRNLFGEAETLNLIGGVAQLGGNSTTGIGYNAGASFVKPDFFQRDQSLQADLGAVKASLNAYDQKAVLAAVLLKRKFSASWSGAVGLSGEQENIVQNGLARDYTLLGLPLTLNYDSTKSPLDPVEGIRASAVVTPIQPFSGSASGTSAQLAESSGTSPFVLLQLAGSTYLDFTGSGRSMLALRGLVGGAVGVGVMALPPDKRFYAGGSATVRGYKYQSIGPRFPNDRPVGGTAVSAGTFEFRQRILDDYAAVAFVDVGQVSPDGGPFTGDWSVGAGIGGRYYTSIGPIRVDVALPLSRHSGSGSFEMYVGIGQAF